MTGPILMLAVVTALAAASAGHAAAEPYHIMTNSPVHVAGDGNEAVTIYGDAPDAQWVDITLDGQTYNIPVRGGSFYMMVPAPTPGAYGVTGVWGSDTLEPGGGDGWVETTTVGHLVDGLLTVLGRGYGDVPAGTVTISPGAHEEVCAGCVAQDAGSVAAGGYVLVSNADTERHLFTTQSAWAAESTGNLDPGESVRLPFNAQGEAAYRCMYHPWLEFSVRSTGTYTPAEPPAGALLLEIPEHAGDAVQVGITHTGWAQVAHIVFIQGGQILSAGAAPLTGGHGVYHADTSGWRVGEVIISVSAGADHATGTISVRPPPGALERAGTITGYSAPDGILINGAVARPAGIIPLDAATEATRQICPVDRQALFQSDLGLAPRGSHYVEGTVLCEGVNLGVYLLESGLAVTDSGECRLAQSGWLAPYCYPVPEDPDAELPPGETVMPDADTTDGTDGGAAAGIVVVKPEGPGTSVDAAEEEAMVVDEPEDPGDTPIIITGDVPAVPDPGGVAEPDFPDVDVCDHLVDPACPCPEGWVRNGEWCDPVWYEGIDGAAETVGNAAGDAGEIVAGPAGGIMEHVTDTAGGFFGWILEALANIPDFFLDLGRWIIDQLGFS